MSYEIDAFRGTGANLTGPLDLEHFADIPNASVATQAIDLIDNPAFIAQLTKFHTEKEINELKKAVYRACIAHGVPLPSDCIVNARMLGVIVP